MTEQLVDIGVNLTHRAFRADLDDVLSRAAQAGVSRMIVTGVSLPGSAQAVGLAATHPGRLFATVGVHPHNARCANRHTLPRLRELVASPGVVALGECGLDFEREFSTRDDQRKWFERQVQMAVELKKPLFLHERAATDAMVEVLSQFDGSLPPAVVHCFTGDGVALDRYLELGLCVGITGFVCDDRRGTSVRELVPRIPDDRLMIETDAPFLLPKSFRPKPWKGRNEPSILPHIAAAVARSRGVDLETVARITTRTAEAFFGLDGSR